MYKKEKKNTEKIKFWMTLKIRRQRWIKWSNSNGENMSGQVTISRGHIDNVDSSVTSYRSDYTQTFPLTAWKFLFW